MSHLTVAIIRENPEELLAPFHEFEGTGKENKYVVDVDCTKEVEEFLSEKLWVGKNSEGEIRYQYEEDGENIIDPKEITRKEYIKLKGESEEIKVSEYFCYKKKDGEWHEKVSMGWFGCVLDEKSPERWGIEFTKLMDGLPDDTLISIYDCHI